MDKLYYIRYNNGYLGNAILWWKHNAKGYTTDINEAGKYSYEEAEKICRNRPQYDIAYECSIIDDNIQAHKTIIDAQYVSLNEASIKF